MKKPALAVFALTLAALPLAFVAGCNKTNDVAPPPPASATAVEPPVQAPAAATPTTPAAPVVAVPVGKKGHLPDGGALAKTDGGTPALALPALPALPAASAVGAAVSAAVHALPTTWPIPAPAASR
jgi:hypothetical protein